MRISREGGDPVEVYTPDLDEPLTIWMPMAWLPDDTIVFSIASVDPDEPLNGIWRVGVDGAEPTKIVAGDRASGIPAAMVADISEETGAMSVYSPLLLGQYSVAWEEPLFWIGSLDDASVTPIPPLDAAGEALSATPAAPGGDVMTPAAPAAISPVGETALLVYRSAEGRYSLATMTLASGEVSPVASLPDGMVIQPVAPQWADDGTVLLMTGDAPVTLTLPAT
jgi:hypothetical protein